MEVKTITINGKPIVMEASFGTNEVFQKNFGKSFKTEIGELYKRFTKLQGFKVATSEEVFENLDVLDECYNISLKLAYGMAKTYDEKIPPYEEWLKTLGDIYEDDLNWLKEVAELSATTFPRSFKGNTANKEYQQ